MKGLGRAQEIPFLTLVPLLCDLGQVIHPLWSWDSEILKRLSPSLRSLPPRSPALTITITWAEASTAHLARGLLGISQRNGFPGIPLSLSFLPPSFSPSLPPSFSNTHTHTHTEIFWETGTMDLNCLFS